MAKAAWKRTFAPSQKSTSHSLRVVCKQKVQCILNKMQSLEAKYNLITQLFLINLRRKAFGEEAQEPFRGYKGNIKAHILKMSSYSAKTQCVNNLISSALKNREGKEDLPWTFLGKQIFENPLLNMATRQVGCIAVTD